MKLNLLDLNFGELEKFVCGMGMPGFRTKQINEWLCRGVRGFGEMTNLPAELRARLDERAYTGLPEIVSCLQSRLDGTCKFLFRLRDGCVIESVLMKYKYGYSVCISSQAGCRMGCKFCASSDIPFSRNLSSGEILGQIIAINRYRGIRIGHVVIMGIGEPLDNYDNIVAFLRRVSSADCLDISCRKISLSTCGVVPGIYRLAEEGLPVTLSVSLHNPFECQRSDIMPINKKYTLDNLFEACKIYIEKTGRRITFEYAMISGVNDSAEHARELSRRLCGMLCHVNLIPVNAVSGKSFSRSPRKHIERFVSILEHFSVSVTVRRELGRDIGAACGQLRKQIMSEGADPENFTCSEKNEDGKIAVERYL